MEPAPVRDKIDVDAETKITTSSWRDWFSKLAGLLTRTPEISVGDVVPTSTPTKIGDVYCDTSADKIYIATGASDSSDWQILN